MDALEEIDSELGVFYFQLGDVVISSEDPYQVFESSPQVTSDQHGEQLYTDIH